MESTYARERSPTHGPAPLPAPVVFGATIALIGLAVLGGWAFDLAPLKSVLPGLVAMKPNAALGLLLAGGALALGAGRGSWAQVGAWLAGLVTLLGLATVSQDLCGWDLGIDQLLFREPPGATFTAHPGRMA